MMSNLPQESIVSEQDNKVSIDSNIDEEKLDKLNNNLMKIMVDSEDSKKIWLMYREEDGTSLPKDFEKICEDIGIDKSELFKVKTIGPGSVIHTNLYTFGKQPGEFCRLKIKCGLTGYLKLILVVSNLTNMKSGCVLKKVFFITTSQDGKNVMIKNTKSTIECSEGDVGAVDCVPAITNDNMVLICLKGVDKMVHSWTVHSTYIESGFYVR